MPNHSTSAGNSNGVAEVCGPRTVIKVLSWRQVTTISHWTVAMEMNEPALSLRVCHTVSTNAESEVLVSIAKVIRLDRKRNCAAREECNSHDSDRGS
jgi:hypothetical protein